MRPFSSFCDSRIGDGNMDVKFLLLQAQANMGHFSLVNSQSFWAAFFPQGHSDKVDQSYRL